VRQHIERHREQLARFISSRSGPYRAEMEVIQTNEENYSADFRSLPSVPAIPVSVLISGRFDAAIWAKRPCEPKACHEQWLRHRTNWLKTFAPDATPEAVIIAHESGHEIQADAPALVVAAIRRVLSAATTASTPSVRSPRSRRP
jgi:hypothetical protein